MIKQRKIKIAYIVHTYTNPGGTERVLSQKANYLAKEGYDMYIISLKDSHKEPFFYYNPAIKIIRLDIPANKPKYKTIFLDKLAKCLKDIKPDIAISTEVGLTSYLYEINDKSKKIMEYHFSKYKRKFEFATLDKFWLGRIVSDLYNYKKNYIVKQYERFIILTDEDKELWRNTPNIEVIPNSLTFMPDKCSDLKAKKVIAVGRFTNQKGFDYLIDIWSIIYQKYPDWKLSIYGEGSKKSYLQNRIDKLNLSKVIELCSPTSTIEKEFLNSSISVMTSRYEGFGLVLVEAMSCGLPVVSFACKCGPKDIIQDGEDGFLIKFKDKKTFADKLSLLIEDYELRQRMGTAARINSQRFSEENIMPQWINLFDELVANNKSHLHYRNKWTWKNYIPKRVKVPF